MSDDLPEDRVGHAAFAAATAIERVQDGRYTATVPPGWEQGRGAYGGLVIGLMIRAMVAEDGTDRPLRAVTAEIPSPLLAGPCEVRVTTLRRGNALNSHEAHIWKDGAVIARASGVFGARRESSAEIAFGDCEPPTAPFDTLPSVPSRVMAPAFTRHLDFRVTGPAPFGSRDDAVVEGWTGFRNHSERSPYEAADIAALADSYWPGFFTVVNAPRPAATVAYTLHLTPAVAALSPGAPLFYRARAHHAAGGYSYEERRLFDASGRLVAFNPQTFVIIK